MAVRWQRAQQQMDDAIDRQWGEQVVVRPWRVGGGGGGLSTDGTDDPFRPAPVDPLIGVYCEPGSTVATAGGSASGSFTSRIAESAHWVSVQQRYLDSLGYELKKDDLVYLPDRATWFALTYIETNATFRPNLHLNTLPANAVPP